MKGAQILRGGQAVEEHLAKNNATASIIGDTMLFHDKVTVSEVLEETHHYEQDIANMNNDKDSALRSLLNEIDAKEYLIDVEEVYNIPRVEREENRKHLEEYRRLLEEYRRENGV